jgi:hypothetical protein
VNICISFTTWCCFLTNPTLIKYPTELIGTRYSLLNIHSQIHWYPTRLLLESFLESSKAALIWVRWSTLVKKMYVNLLGCRNVGQSLHGHTTDSYSLTHRVRVSCPSMLEASVQWCQSSWPASLSMEYNIGILESHRSTKPMIVKASVSSLHGSLMRYPRFLIWELGKPFIC